jgi:GNAT superfamily N-acetyltransferase/RimJ/RimL family protein N-acetyltransferase
VKQISIVAWQPGDEAVAKACHQVRLATMLADDPLGPPRGQRVFQALLASPAEPAQTWLVPGDTQGSARGYFHLRLPGRENRQRASVFLEVHPEHRRHGIGLALLRHAARQAAKDGRTLLRARPFLGSAGEMFARRTGAKPGLADARRVLFLGKLPADQLAALRESAARAAAGYSLVTWTGPVPEEYLGGLAAVSNAMSDAPHDAGHESRVWDAQRIREDLNDQRDLFGTRGYFVAALHAATGEMAAITHIEVDPEYPEWGSQQLTAVALPHRGHRLGLLVKAAMTEWLTDAEPAMRRIVTENAADNKHMIAINEALGYELLDPQTRSYQLPVADVRGAD